VPGCPRPEGLEPEGRSRRTTSRSPLSHAEAPEPSGASAYLSRILWGPSPPRAVPESAVATARLHLTFPGHLASEPILHRLATEFGLVTNVRRANIDEREGWVIVEVDGDDDRIAAAVAWLAEQDLGVDRIDG
jgi:NIL domain